MNFIEKFIQMSYSHSCADKIQKGGRLSLLAELLFAELFVVKAFFSIEFPSEAPESERPV